MKTIPTAEEYLGDLPYYIDPSILTEFAKLQIEALRSELKEKSKDLSLPNYIIKGIVSNIDIDQVINKHLNELK